MKKAKELLFTGNLIDAEEAWRLGMVNKVVPIEKLDEEVDKMARSIAKLSNVQNYCSKRIVNMAYELMNIRQFNEWADEYEVLPSVVAGISPESMPEVAEFNRLRREVGLKDALNFRDGRFAEENAWWRRQRRRSPVK